MLAQAMENAASPLPADALAGRAALIQRGAAYWLEKADGRAMPKRADIDPADIAPLLSNAVLIEVFPEPLDFVERITGETILYHNARNTTGVRWSRMAERCQGSAIWDFFQSVVKDRAPRLGTLPYVGPHRDFLEIEVLALPLADDAGAVCRILTFVAYLSRLRAVDAAGEAGGVGD